MTWGLNKQQEMMLISGPFDQMVALNTFNEGAFQSMTSWLKADDYVSMLDDQLFNEGGLPPIHQDKILRFFQADIQRRNTDEIQVAAASSGKVRVLKFLKERNLFVSDNVLWSQMLLIHAIANGRLAAVNYFLEDMNVNPSYLENGERIPYALNEAIVSPSIFVLNRILSEPRSFKYMDESTFIELGTVGDGRKFKAILRILPILPEHFRETMIVHMFDHDNIALFPSVIQYLDLKTDIDPYNKHYVNQAFIHALDTSAYQIAFFIWTRIPRATTLLDLNLFDVVGYLQDIISDNTDIGTELFERMFTFYRKQLDVEDIRDIAAHAATEQNTKVMRFLL